MILDKLLNGIVTKWAATAALTSAFTANGTGGPFREQATPGAALPFVVLEVVPSAPLTDPFGTSRSADVTVIYKVIGEGHNATAALMALILTAFDDVHLTLTGATTCGVLRNGEPIPTPLGDDFDGSDVWQWAVAYTYHVQ